MNEISSLRIGQWVIIRSEAAPEFIADHGMTGKWDSTIGGVVFLRRILNIDSTNKSIEIDTPIRYPLLVRDHASVYEFMSPIEEVGLSDFSIGMTNVRSRDLNDNDYNTPGTVSYSVHQSHAITFNHAVNSWMKNVESYKPVTNTEDFHILSNAVHLVASKNITVQNTHFQRAEYQGAGGNGYLYTQQGSENLIIQAIAEYARHNFDHSGLEATGNVIVDSVGRHSRLPSDFHMYLSPANLVHMKV